MHSFGARGFLFFKMMLLRSRHFNPDALWIRATFNWKFFGLYDIYFIWNYFTCFLKIRWNIFHMWIKSTELNQRPAKDLAHIGGTIASTINWYFLVRPESGNWELYSIFSSIAGPTCQYKCMSSGSMLWKLTNFNLNEKRNWNALNSTYLTPLNTR